eukprot:1479292-Rhodomonas_salina.5
MLTLPSGATGHKGSFNSATSGYSGPLTVGPGGKPACTSPRVAVLSCYRASPCGWVVSGNKGSFNRAGNGAFDGPLTVGPGGKAGSFNTPGSEFTG